MKKKIVSILVMLCSAFATVGFASCDIASKLPDPDDYENVGTYTLELDDTKFNPIKAYDSEFDCTGLTLLYSQELNGEVFYETTIDVRPDMIVEGGETDSVGEKKVTITYHEETWTIDYTVKYQVDFLADGGAFHTQYVMDASEIVLPEPKDRTENGYVFAYWGSEVPEEISGNISIEAHYYDTKLEGEVPSLSALDRVYDPKATLKDIELPSKENVGKWEFVDELTTPIGGAGKHEFDVRFVPATDELAPVANSKVSINVAKKVIDKPTINENVFTYNGEARTVLGEDFELYTVSNNVQTNAGTYTVGLTLKDPANYAWSTENPDPTFTINKKLVTFEVNNEKFVYDGEAHFPNLKPSDSVNFEVSEEPQINAGTYKYTITVNEENYEGSYTRSFTIAKKAVEFTITKDSFVYDGEEHYPEYTVSDVNAPVSQGGRARVEAGEGYSYRLSVSDPNYSGSLSGTFKITKPDITITVHDKTIVYPAGIPEITYEVKGFENVALLGIQIDKPTTNQAGTYKLTATINNSNVNLVEMQEGVLTIRKGTIEPDKATLSTDNVAATYGDALSTVKILSTGFGSWAWEDPTLIIDKMDEYKAVAVYTSHDDNYEVVKQEFSFKNIAKRRLEIVVDENTYTYTGTEEFTIKYTVNGLLDINEQYDVVTGNITKINAGTYPAENEYTTLSIEDDCYYGSVRTQLIIEKATPVVSLETSKAEVAWAPDLTLGNSGITLKGDGDGSYNWAQKPETAINDLTIDKEYNFTVVYTPKELGNYKEVELPFTITVVRAATGIVGVEENVSFEYNGKAHTLSAKVNRSIETTGVISYEYKDANGNPVNEIVNAGVYTVVIKAAETAHYVATTEEVQVEVTKATITFGEKWQNVNGWTYGGTVKLPTIGVVRSNGGNYEVGIVYTYTDANDVPVTEFTSKTAAGTYTVTATVEDTNNYKCEVTKTQEFTITKATVKEPSLSGTTGLTYNGEAHEVNVTPGEFTISCDNDASVSAYTIKVTNAGTYAITLKLKDATNYKWWDDSEEETIKLDAKITVAQAKITLGQWQNTNGWMYDGEVNLPYVEATRSNGGNYAVPIVYSYSMSHDGEYTEITENTFTTETNVGRYFIKATVEGTNNYTGVTKDPQEFRVQTTAVDMEGVYLEYNAVWEEGLTLSDITPGGDGAGTYAWVVEGGTAETTLLNAETYTNFEVRYTPADPNYHAIEVAVTVSVSHKSIDIPTSAVLTDGATDTKDGNNPVYSGKVWSVATTDADDYTLSSTSATNAGETVEVTFTLKANRVWDDKTNGTKTLTYTVQKADNTDEVKVQQTATYGDRLSKLDIPTSTLGTWKWKEGSNTAVGDVTADDEPRTFHLVFTPYDANNYNPREVAVEVTVVKKAVTHPTLAQSSFVYTGTAPTLTIMDKGNSVGTYNAIEQPKPTEVNVGTYSVVLTLKEETFYNYEWDTADNVSEDGKTLTLKFEITPATPIISGLSITDWTYGEYNEEINKPTASTNFGMISGYTYSTEEDGEYTTTVPTLAGTYYVKAEVAEEATYKNYSYASATKEFTIAKAKVDVPQNPASVFYTGEAQMAEIAETDYYYKATRTETNADSYTVSLTLIDSNNYEWADGKGEVTFTIMPATAEQITLSVEVEEDGWTYGDNPSNMPRSAMIGDYILAEGEALTRTYYDINKKEVAAPSNAGTYYVSVTLVGTNNYESATSELVEFTIAQKDYEPTPNHTPQTLNATYGDSLSKFDLSSFNDEYGEWSWEDATAVVGDVGERTHYAVYTYTDADAALNYIPVAKQAVEITVAKKTLTVNVDTTTFVYNGENQENSISYTITDGETVYTDLNASVSVQQNSEDVAFKNAGSYTVTVTINDNNYAGSAVNVTLKIGKATPTVSVSLAGWTYGTPNAPQATTDNTDGGYTVTYTYSTKENGTYTAVTDFGALDAGTYYVKATVSATDNYVEMTSASAMFTIAKAVVEVPEIASKSYTGGPLKADVVVLKDAEDKDLYTVTNVGGIDVKEEGYPVVLTLTEEAFKNYEWSTTENVSVSTDGKTVTLTFEITKADLTLTKVDIVGWTYGAKEAGKVPEITVKDGVAYNPADVVYVYFDSATNTTVELTTVEDAENNYANYMKALNAGTYSIQVYVKGTGNYKASNYLNTTIVISKAKVAVPTIPALYYTGSTQNSGLKETDEYSVISDNGGIEKGSYQVVLELKKDYTNYEWSKSDNATINLNRITITYQIAAAANVWTTAPIVPESWVFGTTVTLATPVAQFGGGEGDYKVEIVYNGKANDGTEYKDSVQMPDKAGSYTVTFSVKAHTDGDWGALSTPKSFTITKAPVTVPTIDTRDYMGASLTAEATESSNLYTIKQEGWINAGTHNVTLTLNDDDNYVWKNGDETTTIVTFTIKRAETVLTWTPGSGMYNGTITLPKAEANVVVEEILYTYSTEENGTYTETEPTEADTYYVKAFVAGTDDYTEKTISTTFVIEQADPNASFAAFTATNEWKPGMTLADIAIPADNNGAYAWVDDTKAIEKPDTYTTFEATYTPSDTKNYKTVTKEIQVTVNRKTVEITGQDSEFEYNKEYVYPLNIDATGTYDTVKIGFNYVYTKDSETVDKLTDVGTYKVTITLDETSAVYYTATPLEINVTIKQKVNKDSILTTQTAIYGDLVKDKLTLPTNTDGTGTWSWYNVTNTVGNATVNGAPRGFVAVFTPTDTYNYASREVEVKVTVNKKAVDVPTIKSKPYTGKEQSVTITQEEDLGQTIYAATTITGKDAGNHTATLTLSDKIFENFQWNTTENVSTDGKTLTLTFTITKATPTIEWQTTGSGTYGGTITTPTAKVTNIDGVEIKYTYSTDGSNYSSDLPKAAGEWYVKASVAANGNNYSAAEETTTFNIEKATVKVSEITGSQETKLSKSYTGASENLTADVGILKDAEGNALYSVTTNKGGVNVDEYNVVLTLADSDNYKWSTDTTGEEATLTLTFTITQATAGQITLSVSGGWTYNENGTHNISAEAKIGENVLTDAKFSYTYYDEDKVALNPNVRPTDAGTYYLKATLELTDNYESKTTDFVQFTINPKELSVSFTNPGYTYNGSAHFNPDELLKAAGDNANGYTVDIDGVRHGTTTAIAEEGIGIEAGIYTITLTLNNPESVANYVWASDDDVDEYGNKVFTYTINKAVVSAKLAENQSFTYNGDDREAEVTVTANDGAITLTLGDDNDYTLSGNVRKDAGNHNITVMLIDTNNYTWTNNASAEAVKTLEGVFVIGQAKPIVKVDDISINWYSGLDFEAVLGEGLSGTATGVKGEDVKGEDLEDKFDWGTIDANENVIYNDVNGVTYETGTPLNAITYTFNVTFKSADPNYADTNGTVTVVVNPKGVDTPSLEITDGTTTIAGNPTYSGEAWTPVAESGDDYTVTYTENVVDAIQTIIITFTLEQDNDEGFINRVWANKTFTGSVSYTVQQVQNTQPIGTLTATYGQTLADIALQLSEYNDDYGTWSWEAAGTKVGDANASYTYKANYTVKDENNYRTNYADRTDVDVTVSVSPQTVGKGDIKELNDALNKTYTYSVDEDKTPIYQLPLGESGIEHTNGVATITCDGYKITITMTSGDSDGKIVFGADAGTYIITLKVDNANYVLADGYETNGYTYTIGKATNAITVEGIDGDTLGNSTYNGSPYKLPETLTVTATSDTVTATYYYLNGTDPIDVPTDVGNYKVVFTAGNDNYEDAEEVAKFFNITKANITLSITYGDNKYYYQNQLTGDIIKDIIETVGEGGEDVKGVFSDFGNLTFDSNSVNSEGVSENSYFTIKFTPTGDDAENYNYSSDPITVNINLKGVAYTEASGTRTYYGTIEAALNVANGAVWVVPDISGKVVITGGDSKLVEIRSGVTLILPYGTLDAPGRNSNSTATLRGDSTKTSDYSDPKFYGLEALECKTRVIVAEGVKITVYGTLEIAGELSGSGGGQPYAGHTARYYAELVMNKGAEISIKNDGILNCYGFIHESSLGNESQITVENGATLYMPFVLRDFRGGSYMYAVYKEMNSKRISAFNQFELRNITSKIRVNYGGSLKGYANLYASYQHNATTIALIGTSPDNFIQMTDSTYSYITAKYNAENVGIKDYTAKTDGAYCELKVYGGAKTNVMSLEVNVGVKVTVSTDAVFFPLTWRYHITLDNAEDQAEATFTMGQRYKLMPGSQLIVEQGAKLIVSVLNIYNKFEDKCDIAPKYGIDTQENDLGLDPAVFMVKGKVEADELNGEVSTDCSGAEIKITTTGVSPSYEATTISGDLFMAALAAEQTIECKLALPRYDGGTAYSTADTYYSVGNSWISGDTEVNVAFGSLNEDGVEFEGTKTLVDNNSSKAYSLSTDFSKITPTHDNTTLRLSFNGWYYWDGDSFESYQGVLANYYSGTTINLYALWLEEDVYEIKFEMGNNGGYDYTMPYTTVVDNASASLIAPDSFENGTKLDSNNKINSYEWYFEGWYIDSGFKKKYENWNQLKDIKPEGDETFTRTLYAKWTQKKKITITITEKDWAGFDDTKFGVTYTLTVYDSNKKQIGDPSKVTDSRSDSTTYYYVYPGFYIKLKVEFGDLSGSIANDTDVQVNGDMTATIAYDNSETCFVEGTLITLADGTQKKVEDLTTNDLLLTFNHFTGEYEARNLWFMDHSDSELALYRVTNLVYSDGTILRLIGTHEVFDLTLNKYVAINESNMSEFVGHRFYKTNFVNGEFIGSEIVLERAYVTEEYTRYYSPASVGNINSFAEGLLTSPPRPHNDQGYHNYFEFGEKLKYNEEIFNEDIEKYGLYSYEELAEYISYETYINSPVKYFKVAVGKGYMTFEELEFIIKYLLSGDLIT